MDRETYLREHPGYRLFHANGLYPRGIIAHPRSCFFCDNCTDIFYDSDGPYMWFCRKDGDTELGVSGKCEYFEEEK